MQYNPSGSYLALAGIAVLGLAKIGIVTDTNSIITIGAGVLALIGVIKQFLAHKKLATIAGVYLK